METATEYLKRVWCDPIWEHWERGDMIEAMEEFKSDATDLILKEIERRVDLIKSEPNGIVRETMIDNILISFLDVSAEPE